MTDKKPDPTSDADRTGKDADKNRADLAEGAKKGVEKATGKKPGN